MHVRAHAKRPLGHAGLPPAGRHSFESVSEFLEGPWLEPAPNYGTKPGIQGNGVGQAPVVRRRTERHAGSRTARCASRRVSARGSGTCELRADGFRTAKGRPGWCRGAPRARRIWTSDPVPAHAPVVKSHVTLPDMLLPAMSRMAVPLVTRVARYFVLAASAV